MKIEKSTLDIERVHSETEIELAKLEDRHKVVGIKYEGLEIRTNWKDSKLNILIGVLKICSKVNNEAFEEISLLNLLETDNGVYKPYKLCNPIYIDSNIRLADIKNYIINITDIMGMENKKLTFIVE